MTRTRALLLDIEGTTTSIAFVHDTLFPLARRAMPEFVEQHRDDPRFATELHAVRSAVAEESGISISTVKFADLSALLCRWIDADKKETALKTIQGEIWRAAYESGDVLGHVYPDVAVAFRRWRRSGLELHVFSSGSVAAQRLLFAHTRDGDLTVHLGRYFDTTLGSKRESKSYREISAALERAAGEILFLSDVVAELDAARLAGLATCLLLRGSTTPDPASTHATARTFDEILP